MARVIDLKNKKAAKPARPKIELRLDIESPKPQPQPAITEVAKEKVEPVVPQAEPVTKEFPKEEIKTGAMSWSGPIREHHPRMRNVVILVLFLFVVGALVQIFQKNIITAVFFGLLGVTILIHARKVPEVVDFEIGASGVKVKDRTYNYRDLKSFWIEYEPELGIRELSLQSKKWYTMYVKIPLGEQSPVQIRSLLVDFLPEVEHEDTLADTFSRKFGL